MSQENWKAAALRFRDMANLVAQLAPMNENWQPFTADLRQFAEDCNRLNAGERKRFRASEWRRFQREIHALLDQTRDPFSEFGG